MAASLEPLHQARDLGRTPRSVRSFDDDEFTRQLFQIDSGNAVAVKALGRRLRHQDPALGQVAQRCGDASSGRTHARGVISEARTSTD